MDAYFLSLDAMSGNGVSPPSEACDFARFCSQLDFWSINDHAEFVSPEAWADTKEAIRACNASTGGYGKDPDMVSFLGWEWTQMSNEPETGYGHKNVILLDTEEDRVPARPIAASSVGPMGSVITRLQGPELDILVRAASSIDPANAQEYESLGKFLRHTLFVQTCPEGVDTRGLPADCREYAATPAVLFEKLTQWGFESLVIPHGTTWGMPHPPLSDWDNQLDVRNDDPERQRLVEIFSGHGNSEEYRSWSAYRWVDGKKVCPEPTANYLPCCRRAGEIIRERTPECTSAPEGNECLQAVRQAQQDHMDSGLRGALAFPDVPVEAWLDCGQCRDCFQPAFKYVPTQSVQAALARTKRAQTGESLRYRWGFIGSTDEHRSSPGSGFREDKRFSELNGATSPDFDALATPLWSSIWPEWERQGSYWFTGALAAVHSEGRSRRAIWNALKRRETYGTSGDRLLLWFDLVGDQGAERFPMGSEVRLSEVPHFEVKAIGAFKQNPGCPAESVRKARPGFVERRCFGECYNPTDERYRITRIEVVRIRPQIREDESLGKLIEDPWKVLECPDNPEGCSATFEDLEFSGAKRLTAYYVRAIQEPTPQINAAGLRCTLNREGECMSIKPCFAGYRGKGDSCADSGEERAWSSPIYVEWGE